jgi:hypothetical protein
LVLRLNGSAIVTNRLIRFDTKIELKNKDMTTLTKSLALTAGLGLIGGAILDFGGFAVAPFCTVILPFGAVAFELFLISLMLEKVMAEFDAEEAQKAQKNQEDTGESFDGRDKMSACGTRLVSTSQH